LFAATVAAYVVAIVVPTVASAFATTTSASASMAATTTAPTATSPMMRFVAHYDRGARLCEFSAETRCGEYHQNKSLF